MKRPHVRRFAVALIGLVLLSACKVRVELDTTINADESGSVSFAFGFDKKFRDALEGFASGFGEGDAGGFNPLGDLESNAPEGWKVERYKDGEFEGVRISRDFDDLSDLAQALEETEGFGESDDELGGSAAPTPGFESFQIERDGDLFTLDLGADGLDFSQEAGENPFGGEDNPFGELEFEVIMRVTLPGKVLEHNADSQDGSTLTWTFTQDSEPRAISAVSDASQGAGGGDSDFPVLPVVVVVALLLGGGAFLVLRNRSQAPAAAGAVPGGDTPAPPPPGEAAPPPPPPEE